MANAIGSLLVRLGLDDVEYRTGLTKAEYQAQQFQRKMDANFAKAARFVGALGIGAAVGAFVKNTISSASALDDLSDATGSSVENLSKLANQAKISGTDFGTLEGLVHKLSAGMAGADDESSNVGRALKFLGVSAKDPAEALQQVAVSLDKFRDGIGKAALARDLFGKGGPAFLATLKDIANLQDVVTTTTTKQAAEAEKLEQALRRLTVEGTLFKNALLSDVVPALNSVMERFKLAREAGLGFFAAFNISTTKVLSASIGEVGSTYAQQFSGLLNEAKADVEHFAKAVEAAKRSPLPDFFLVPQSKYDDAVKKLNALKAIQRSLALAGSGDTSMSGTGDARDALVNRKPVLDYTGTRGVTGAIKAAKAGVDEYARALDNVAKMAGVAGEELQAAFSGEELTSSMKALAGLMASPVWEKFTEQQQIQLMVEYDAVSAIQKETAEWRRKREEQEKLIRTYADIADAQARARDQVTASLGAYAEQNDALARGLAIVGQEDVVRQKLAATLEHERNLKQALAAGEELSAAAFEKQYQRRLGLLESFDQANKLIEQQQKSKEFVESLGSAFGHAAEDAIVFGRTARDVLKALEQDLSRILTRRLVTQPLEAGINSLLTGMGVGNLGAGSTGTATNWGAMLAKIAASYFGGGSSAATNASWAAMSAATIPSFASGTNYAPGGWAKVHRDEVINLPRGSQVIPNSELTARREARGGNTYVINAPVAAGTTRQSVAQAAGELRRAIMMTERNS